MLRGIVLGLLLLTASLPARAQGDQQALVDRAALAVQELLTTGDGAQDARSFLRRARAVMICPRIFRAGFILGGEGGSCALVGRDGAGSWSSPAFYQLGAGSVGLQIGIQDAMVMMMIMTDRGLQAVMDSQFTLGADASIAIATIGGGIQGGTTTAAGADIVSVARSRGLFAGISLQGSILTFLSDWVRGYYGRDYSARQIVVGMEAHNPGSDPLRAMLLQHGAAN
jgi:lipid-binding SYLF domain-containing protein